MNALRRWYWQRRLDHLIDLLIRLRADRAKVMQALDLDILAVEAEKRGILLKLLDLQTKADRHQAVGHG